MPAVGATTARTPFFHRRGAARAAFSGSFPAVQYSFSDKAH
ncbi:hypothetical protein C7S16_1055 [Burkholderia thailandensis]|uniref:Uncharacterized protein n=2 Tax=Burkholderia thailandensis TaxID=57975 RepID=A0AAW9CVZ0_BURTH|nr:hypothetical protein BTH_I2119 [Burkholderia thailandensis E264]MDW9239391.1 hypothetical protein [Burkholderia thailandensis]MDW9254322.1 hypothetical protein [Burkholderia thailandensis]